MPERASQLLLHRVSVGGLFIEVHRTADDPAEVLGVVSGSSAPDLVEQGVGGIRGEDASLRKRGAVEGLRVGLIDGVDQVRRRRGA